MPSSSIRVSPGCVPSSVAATPRPVGAATTLTCNELESEGARFGAIPPFKPAGPCCAVAPLRFAKVAGVSAMRTVWIAGDEPPTETVVDVGVYPLRTTRTAYVPSGKPSNVTTPATLVVACRTVGPSATTSAPATGLPFASRTVETIAPGPTSTLASAGGVRLATKTAVASTAKGKNMLKSSSYAAD
jgi:hypothetical protein